MGGGHLLAITFLFEEIETWEWVHWKAALILQKTHIFSALSPIIVLDKMAAEPPFCPKLCKNFTFFGKFCIFGTILTYNIA